MNIYDAKFKTPNIYNLQGKTRSLQFPWFIFKKIL